MAITDDISTCTLCSQRFAGTATGHQPRPVVWFGAGARILVAGQAPGARVHASGKPFDDPSGDRLRDWMGIDRATFYDMSRIAVLPMAFCFPGYNAKGADLPPPPVCHKTWRKAAMDHIGPVPLTLLIGGYAQKWHLNARASVTDTVAGWRDHAPAVFPLPHPSWRNTGWIRKNPWFASDLLPALREAVQKALT
ncbi:MULTISPECIES: uracil-DNA glycosylase family protein [Roseobacteraceae]|jgi:uracil-DNA glycosylase|uniref:Uracil DNA glycosylase superfamily protein n=1 Tax=Pseudosulfitobacter pseudonitzschiae TaxID=1402135 RepID=A0A221JX22_9RHOB|nr:MULTISPECIES: uracil-DNA glycosylase family protein [Roseobacteraceae]ASM71274.1 uracil DNA glycosylase superfamily protein [Pseudosulfitobacter pseudonitzschiae]